MAVVQIPCFDISDPLTGLDETRIVLSYLDVTDLSNLHLVNNSWRALLDLTDPNNCSIECYSECVLNKLKKMHDEFLNRVLDPPNGHKLTIPIDFDKQQRQKSNKRNFIKYTMPLLGQISSLLFVYISNSTNIKFDKIFYHNNITSANNLHYSLLKFVKYHNFFSSSNQPSEIADNNYNDSYNSNESKQNEHKLSKLKKNHNDQLFLYRQMVWFLDETRSDNPFVATLYKYTLSTFRRVCQNYCRCGGVQHESSDVYGDSTVLRKFERDCKNVINFYSKWKLIGGYSISWTHFYYTSILYSNNVDLCLSWIVKLIENYKQIQKHNQMLDNDQSEDKKDDEQNITNPQSNRNIPTSQKIKVKLKSILEKEIFLQRNGPTSQCFVDILIICIEVVLFQLKQQKKGNAYDNKSSNHDHHVHASKVAKDMEFNKIEKPEIVAKNVMEIVGIMTDLTCI